MSSVKVTTSTNTSLLEPVSKTRKTQSSNYTIGNDLTTVTQYLHSSESDDNTINDMQESSDDESHQQTTRADVTRFNGEQTERWQTTIAPPVESKSSRPFSDLSTKMNNLTRTLEDSPDASKSYMFDKSNNETTANQSNPKFIFNTTGTNMTTMFSPNKVCPFLSLKVKT